MATTREALEAALAAEPENVALHSAYADLLIEEGDPRGEFIRLKLMLEDAGLKVGEREELEQRAESMLTEFESLWLGPLGEYVRPWNERIPQLFEGNDPYLVVKWKRGWIDSISVKNDLVRVGKELRRCPLSRLIRRCHFQALRREYPKFDNVFSQYQSFPFREYSVTSFYWVGDRLIELIVASSMDQHLQQLSLHGCGITDAGAEMLAGSRIVRRLTGLSLKNNVLSPIGIAALAEVGFAAGQQRFNPGWATDAD